MNVLWICSEVGGVNWFRAKMPHDAYKAMFKRDDTAIIHYDPELIVRRNWEFDLYGPKSFEIKSDILLAVGWADVVVWMGLHSPESLNLFKLCGLRYPHVKMLMEIDDYLLSSARSNPGAGELYRYGGDLAKIGLEQMRLSDGLIVSTPSLAELYRPYAKNIHVVENTVDLKLWPKRKKNRKLTIGWIGAGSHDDDLGLIKNAVPHILAKYPDVQFSIVHGAPEFFKHKPDCEYLKDPHHPRYNKMKKCPLCKGLDRVLWTHDFRTIDKYPKWAASFGLDIGLAPLVDLNFTRGKSNLRWLEYSAMGTPTIASPLNHFVETIKDGETGLIVKSKDEQGWIDAIDSLIVDKDLRERIGKNARNEVKLHWSPKSMAQKYKKAIQEITHAVNDKGAVGDEDQPVDRRPEQRPVYSGTGAGRNSEMAGAVCP
jgi:glycosyltransferase involved in cell wall biosynthesis